VLLGVRFDLEVLKISQIFPCLDVVRYQRSDTPSKGKYLKRGRSWSLKSSEYLRQKSGKVNPGSVAQCGVGGVIAIGGAAFGSLVHRVSVS
jgi:hypothetical protein